MATWGETRKMTEAAKKKNFEWTLIREKKRGLRGKRQVS